MRDVHPAGNLSLANQDPKLAFESWEGMIEAAQVDVLSAFGILPKKGLGASQAVAYLVG